MRGVLSSVLLYSLTILCLLQASARHLALQQPAPSGLFAAADFVHAACAPRALRTLCAGSSLRLRPALCVRHGSAAERRR